MYRKPGFQLNRIGNPYNPGTMPTDIADIHAKTQEFREQLNQAKRATGPEGFWYPYGSLENFGTLDMLLTGEHRYLFDSERSPIVADIGAADGDVAFLLAQLGAQVDIVDHGPTNFNGLQGARRLAEHFNTTVRVVDVDLDHHFELPRSHYDLALFLGILYHLKNPFNAMESLSRYAHHCVLSTRVAKFHSDRTTRIDEMPVAYLLGANECNSDSTNFWIFSEAGLRRLFERTGWRVLEWITVGDPESDPADMAHDQRVFCLLENTGSA
jgi:tRNA (mo5U34)-methyltransferase